MNQNDFTQRNNVTDEFSWLVA